MLAWPRCCSRASLFYTYLVSALKRWRRFPPWRPAQWRWRIIDAVDGSDLYRKSGDDFPARVYVLFDYDLGRLPFLTRWKLRFARLAYGDSVPGAALCYVPAGQVARETIVPNAYTERVRMIVVDDDAIDKGWRVFERDVVRDFEAAFGEPAPRIIGIAIATDTDDTGETARTWFGDLTLSPQSSAGSDALLSHKFQ